MFKTMERKMDKIAEEDPEAFSGVVLTGILVTLIVLIAII